MIEGAAARRLGNQRQPLGPFDLEGRADLSFRFAPLPWRTSCAPPGLDDEGASLRLRSGVDIPSVIQDNDRKGVKYDNASDNATRTDIWAAARKCHLPIPPSLTRRRSSIYA